MNILVIGGGGREHALAWKLAQSHKVQAIYVAPGNAGTARDKLLQNVPITDIHQLCAFAIEKNIGLTVVGPEAPLAAGVVDVFRDKGLRIFGPTQAAAQLESSKAFSKAFMQRHHIPTAEFETFTDADAAHRYIEAKGSPIVVKADGLAAGKGVVVAMTLQEAHEAVDFMLLDNKLGVSFIVMCDGKTVLPLATSQDHKRLQDADLGPNTGGMGAYSPAPVVTPQVHSRVMREIIMPTIKGMEQDGIPFTGFLYAGLMIDKAGHVKTLEFNCRMGDPETQPIMMRLKSDLVDVLMAATETQATTPLQDIELQWDRQSAVGVVMASHGYPASSRSGDVISGLPADREDAMVFHAATKLEGSHVVTSGGRVLCVSALGGTLKLAQQKAYDALNHIQFDGMHFRRDIGYRAIQR
jgi:phosphoribosylamine--glycine ligase